MSILATFTPGEAEQITGVPTARQRDYRRHGYLPSSNKHARFDTYALARLWAFGLLGAQGIGPSRVKRYVDVIAAGIVYHALCTSDGDVIALHVHRQHSGYGGAIVPRFFTLFPDGSEHWDKSVDGAIGAMSPEGVERFNSEIAEHMERLPLEDRRCMPTSPEVIGRAKRDRSVPGAIIVLDQQQLGEMLVQRAGRPLVEVD